MIDQPQNLTERIALRPAVLPGDEEFLIELYYTTRDDLREAPMDEAQIKMISRMQYFAQTQHYETSYQNSGQDLILFDGEAVGRIWTARDETEIRCVDISILPERRNLGIGSALLKELADEAERTERDFTLHVLKTNTKAIRLYQRLNFEFTDETVSHFRMRRRPGN